MYTRSKHWNPPLTSNFFKVVLAKSLALSDIDDSNPKVARFVKRAKHCGFQGIVEEEVRFALSFFLGGVVGCFAYLEDSERHCRSWICLG